MRIRRLKTDSSIPQEAFSKKQRSITKENLLFATMLTWALIIAQPVAIFVLWKKGEESNTQQSLKGRVVEIANSAVSSLNASLRSGKTGETLMKSGLDKIGIKQAPNNSEIFLFTDGSQIVSVQYLSENRYALKPVDFFTNIVTKEGERAHILTSEGTLVGTSEYRTATSEEVQKHPGYPLTKILSEDLPLILTPSIYSTDASFDVAAYKIPNTNLSVLYEIQRTNAQAPLYKTRLAFLLSGLFLFAFSLSSMRLWKKATNLLEEHAWQAQASKNKIQKFILLISKNARKSFQANDIADAVTILATSALEEDIIRDVGGIQVILPGQMMDPHASLSSQAKFHFEHTLEGQTEIVFTMLHPVASAEEQANTPQTTLLTDDCMFMRLRIFGKDQGFLICSREAFSDNVKSNMDLGLLLLRALSSQLEIAIENIPQHSHKNVA